MRKFTKHNFSYYFKENLRIKQLFLIFSILNKQNSSNNIQNLTFGSLFGATEVLNTTKNYLFNFFVQPGSIKHISK